MPNQESQTREQWTNTDQSRGGQTLSLLRIYNTYRVLVGIALFLIYTQNWLRTDLGRAAPEAFFWALTAYIASNLVLSVLTRLLPELFERRQLLRVGIIAIDILWLAVLMAMSAGVGSGLDGFMLVTVTAGAIIVADRSSLLTAALATIAVLYQELFTAFRLPDEPNGFFQAGVLGILFFVFTLFITNISNRLRQNELRNISQTAELADLERVNQQVIQRMQTGIVVVDEHDHVRTFNQAARRLLGQMHDQQPLALPEQVLVALDSWRNNQIRGVAAMQLDTSGPSIRVSFSSVRIDDPKGLATIYMEDNSEIQQQAQQLKLSELGRLSASIAHEIRNPLAAISHAAQLLQESRNLDKGDERLTAIIHNHTKRMNAVVENVLLLSRRQPSTPERTGLLHLISVFAKEYAESEPEATFSVDVNPPDTQVRVDPRQIRQVLTNLVTNALRHGGNTQPVVRLVGGIDQQTDRPFLSVIDNGSGVPLDQEKQLFEPFHTTQAKGTGLGLYLSREICAANQARLTYTRNEGGGAVFRILFTHPDRFGA